MGRYFCNESELNCAWDRILSAFWQRYPNPFSTHVLTEDVLFREVTPDNCLLSRRLFTKTNLLPRWAERVFPSHLNRSVYIVEDSVVDPKAHTLTTHTLNVNHTRFMKFGLARFKSNQVKSMKGLEYALSKLHSESQPSRIHGDQDQDSPLPPATQKPQEYS
ncbi:PRELI domain containing 1b isoform X3 [Esox lucius]|uniref:PRELI domain containing 1b isoform X3 n=1 Tax=Esox lucius TaxID=8010 RepID=UPI0005762851|nr:PRELI domain containing 1b isoform X3 [Esox lucius]